ncbi:Brr1p [Kluyveromyces lactis]|uniref:KLLA0B08525p n=1 Tax=Kluyveromyces lactis (strain ATCC 8585 / CBS 2359 / DSM 70799 / NBRC 1267 / NRRL Y-1140 / WM37) TaxID=284590 RepID=Q6CVY1_KLULA|nr:uncharacterized protein KLLA0_B08525g [Kluyveromyces lactis]CAH02301.1 KLLA0B08525p [Kluyveromyces lactis]|eukprot:XP_451908.1 uncharacterized protein KLLA0_B08525g [Kluyveromyces lactis]
MVGVDSNQGPLDPVFGQHSAFALNDEGVSPNVIRYLLDVRNEALSNSPLYSTSRTEQNSHNVVETGLVADTSDLLNARSILEDSEAINEWINEIRKEMEPLEESPSDSIYTDDMLDLLVSEIKKYLDQHPEEINDPVRRVTRSVLPIANPEYDISTETVQSMVAKLRNKRFSDVSFLKRYINRPMPIPTNFRQWFGHIKHNEPTRQFMLRLEFDDLMKILGFMIQWINSITKNKPDSKQLQQWLLYIWIFMPNELLSPQISQLRDLGRKCQLSLIAASNSKITSLTMPTEIRDIPFPNQRDQLNAIEITLAVIAHRFGQRDLLRTA